MKYTYVCFFYDEYNRYPFYYYLYFFYNILISNFIRKYCVLFLSKYVLERFLINKNFQ